VPDHDTAMTRRVILAVVWAYAVLVWGSMAHVFLGLPDLGPVVGPTLFAAILLAPLARRPRLPAITKTPQARSAKFPS
jgi:hypothetical protein